MSVLQLESVSAGYRSTPVLHEISFNVERGSVVALLGRNGMGKSTTVSAIAGLLPTTSGSIIFHGVDVTMEGAIRRARRGVALVPERRQVFRSCTVREHLTMGARRGPSGAVMWPLDRIFEVFPVLKERAKARGSELSGGEQQMLAIARALSSNPDLLLLDEPSEGLAPAIVQQIAEVLRQLATSNTDGGILLVEQDVRLALSVADQVIVLSRGEVVFTGPRGEFVSADDVQSRYIGIA